jgi:drug/metabolite transporter (DMT)-like permease
MPQVGLMFNIILLALLWGPSFLFIKIAVGEISPITLVALRIGISAALLLILLKIRKISLPKDLKLWKHCFFMGGIASSLPFTLYGYSLEHIDSILSALINSTTPVTTLILANLFLKDERFTLNRCLGVTLGLSGFLVLCVPALFTETLNTDLLGMLFSLLASICYAVGMVYARKFIKAPKDPLVLPTMQSLTSLIYLIPLSIFIDPPVNWLDLSAETTLSVVGLAALGTVLAFIIYYHVVIQFGATALSTVTYILPIFSTLIGVAFGNEAVSLHFCVAATLILLGTMVANGVIPFRSRKPNLIKA